MSDVHLPETEEAAAEIIRQHFNAGEPLNIQGATRVRDLVTSSRGRFYPPEI